MSRLITVSEDRLRQELTAEEVERLLELRDKRDAEIDTSDIPEITELPAGAVRGKFYRGAQVTLRPDLLEYFTALAQRKGLPLEQLVNDTLAKAVAVAEVAR